MKSKRRILVVDDNVDYCESVIDFLELEGFEAVGVHDGYKAIESIKNEATCQLKMGDLPLLSFL